MRIVVVENDYYQVELLRQKLGEEFFESHRLNIDQIKTESEFYVCLDSIAKNRPSLILIDVMMKWAEVDDLAEAPKEVIEGGYQRAGLRCALKLATREDTKDIPVILYTVLESRDLRPEILTLPQNVRYMRKDSNPDALFESVSKLTGLRRRRG